MTRDALAKAVYGHMFKWTIQKVRDVSLLAPVMTRARDL